MLPISRVVVKDEHGGKDVQDVKDGRQMCLSAIGDSFLHFIPC
jgi:hypothetical protein